MRVLQLCFSLLLGFSVSLSAQPSASTLEYQLDNGLKLIVREDHRAPVVVSMVWYQVGGSYEPIGLTGISHALEHMMFKGTKQLPPGEGSRLLAEYGIEENAFTSRDYTAYFQLLSKENLALAFAREADRMLDLQMTQEDFSKEIQVIMEERRLRTEDNPQALLYERFLAAAHPASAYRNPVVGWQSDLERMQVDDLQQWYQQWYAPNNAVLVVVGDVSGPEVFTLAKRYFSAHPAQTMPRAVQPLDLPAPGLRQLDLSSAQAQVPLLLMGFNVPSLTTTQEEWEPYALRMLVAILDGGESARLSRELVRGRQIASGAGASYDAFARGDSLFLLSATPAGNKNHTLQDLETALQEQINQLQQTPPTEAELARVRAQLTASLVFKRDSIQHQAQEIGSLESIGLSWQLLEQDLEKLQRITPEQIQQVAQRYLQPERLTVARLTPATEEQN